METTSCFSYFYGDVIDCCSTLPLCVFYNWLRLVHNPVNNASPFCSSPRYGKIVSTKAILDKTTNKCKGVWSCFSLSNNSLFYLSSNSSGLWWTALLDSQMLTLSEKLVNIQTSSHSAALQSSQMKSGNRQPGCLNLPPSSCYFKPRPLSVGVSPLWVDPGKKWPTPPLPAEWQCWSWSSSSRLPIGLKRDLVILSGADGIKRMLCHSPLDYTDAS